MLRGRNGEWGGWVKLAESLGDHGELRSLLRICAPAEKIALVPCILMLSYRIITNRLLRICGLLSHPLGIACERYIELGRLCIHSCIHATVPAHTLGNKCFGHCGQHTCTLAASVATGGREVYYWKSLCWGRRGKGCEVGRNDTAMQYNK